MCEVEFFLMYKDNFYVFVQIICSCPFPFFFIGLLIFSPLSVKEAFVLAKISLWSMMYVMHIFPLHLLILLMVFLMQAFKIFV